NGVNSTVSVTGSTFTHNRGDNFQFATNASATGTNTITFSNNTVTGDRGTTYGGTDLGGGVQIDPDASATTNYTISGNTITGAGAGGAGVLAHSLTGAAAAGGTDCRLPREGASATSRLRGYAGGSSEPAGVVNFLTAHNGAPPTGSVASRSGGLPGAASWTTR